MAKAKVYGFSPWVDQVDAINEIMEDTGERNESAVLRKLVDEALDTRRKKSQSTPLTEKSDNAGDRLKTIESLLMRLVRRETRRFVSMMSVWRFYRTFLLRLMRLAGSMGVVGPAQLLDAGIHVDELENRFIIADAEAKNYAYGLAEEIKQSEESEK